MITFAEQFEREDRSAQAGGSEGLQREQTNYLQT